MALLGATSTSDLRQEPDKLAALLALAAPPDIVADLSLRQTPGTPLWGAVVSSGCVASVLPIYTVPERRGGRIEPRELLDRALEQIDGGAGMMTIHPTARTDILELARRRRVPCTSRGGGLVLKDLLLCGGHENVYLKILPDLSAAAGAAGVALSLGATFRSANIFDSYDAAQRAEIDFQMEIARALVADGCQVILEGPGHARPTDIRRIAHVLGGSGFPVMPLGPIPTDTAVGQDHVSSAIGATLMGIEGAAHILAAVTREEHTGGIPSRASVIEAVQAAQVAAHVIDLHVLGDVKEDRRVVEHRVKHRTCIDGREAHGCDRCAAACPLWNVPS